MLSLKFGEEMRRWRKHCFHRFRSGNLRSRSTRRTMHPTEAALFDEGLIDVSSPGGTSRMCCTVRSDLDSTGTSGNRV